MSHEKKIKKNNGFRDSFILGLVIVVIFTILLTSTAVWFLKGPDVIEPQPPLIQSICDKELFDKRDTIFTDKIITKWDTIRETKIVQGKPDTVYIKYIDTLSDYVN